MMLRPYTVYEIAERIEECVDQARDSKGHGVESALDDLMSLVGDLYEHRAVSYTHLRANETPEHIVSRVRD